MENGYIRERQLDALAEAMYMVAGEFEKPKKLNVAIVGYVLLEMILSKFDVLDSAIDDIIKQAKI
ncbi:MAG: hypothetical protein ACOX8Q_04380 [Christensenellales bacterium]|jgi:hypothetical protein